MKRFRLVLAIACGLASVPSFAQLPTQPFLFGEWEGIMTVVPKGDAGNAVVVPYQGEQFQFRLDIRDTNLVMKFPDGSGGWQSIGEGSDLRLNQAARSAIVVAAMASGNPTETWMLNIARWDEPRIAVFLSQVVSVDDTNSQPARPFTAFGYMERVSQ